MTEVIPTTNTKLENLIGWFTQGVVDASAGSPPVYSDDLVSFDRQAYDLGYSQASDVILFSQSPSRRSLGPSHTTGPQSDQASQ